MTGIVLVLNLFAKLILTQELPRRPNGLIPELPVATPVQFWTPSSEVLAPILDPPWRLSGSFLSPPPSMGSPISPLQRLVRFVDWICIFS